jgi:predicted Zn-dependent protease
VFSLSVAAYASNLGTLSCWYATYTKTETSCIGRWAANTLTVRTIKLNSDTSFRFLPGVNHAASEWKDVLGITINTSSTASTGNIEYYGGTRSEITAYTGYTLPTDSAGQTRYYYKGEEGTWTYGSSSKTGYLFSFIYCYMVDASDDYEYNVATHELGHALGWMGHTPNSSAVMYHTESSVITLTNIDKNHLSQVY